jgi:hypothetical protein
VAHKNTTCSTHFDEKFESSLWLKLKTSVAGLGRTACKDWGYCRHGNPTNHVWYRKHPHQPTQNSAIRVISSNFLVKQCHKPPMFWWFILVYTTHKMANLGMIKESPRYAANLHLVDERFPNRNILGYLIRNHQPDMWLRPTWLSYQSIWSFPGNGSEMVGNLSFLNEIVWNLSFGSGYRLKLGISCFRPGNFCLWKTPSYSFGFSQL